MVFSNGISRNDCLVNRADMWKEDYYKEHKRAEKLYDDWKKLKDEK